MSKMRWADSSSDEEERAIRVPVFQQSGFNDGVVQVGLHLLFLQT
jgi:hypothetical protein